MQAFAAFFEHQALVSLFHQHLLHRSTVGRDGITPTQFASVVHKQVEIIRQKVNSGAYRFTAYREMLRPKGADVPPRVLSAPTVRDQLVLRALKEYLHSNFPSRVDPAANQWVRRAKAEIYKPRMREIQFYRSDISAFYDTIDHSVLLQKLEAKRIEEPALKLIRSAIRTPTLPVPADRASSRKARNALGIPQGLAVSNILASLYLQDFDSALESESLFYARYVDDLLILHDEPDHDRIESTIDTLLDQLNLKRNAIKTRHGGLSDEFDFLGYLFQTDKVTIRRESVHRFLDTIAGLITRFRRGLPAHLGRHPWLRKDTVVSAFIEDLNERITGAISEKRRYGWLFYFDEMNDPELLRRLDANISEMVRRSSDLQSKASLVKRLARAYYIAHHTSRPNYFHDYNKAFTVKDKADYLARRGLIVPTEFYKDEVINTLFEKVKTRRLKALEADIGQLS